MLLALQRKVSGGGGEWEGGRKKCVIGFIGMQCTSRFSYCVLRRLGVPLALKREAG